MAMGSHQSAKMETDEWLTPPEIFSSLGEFNLDPCSPHPDRRPWPTAKNHFHKEMDGLSQNWQGRVWLNPPYSREAVKWLRKLAKHGNGIALIFARTETSWFFESVWSKADAILFFKGRLYFHRVDGTRARANAGAPSCLVAYGENNVAALENCGLTGKLVKLKGDHETRS